MSELKLPHKLLEKSPLTEDEVCEILSIDKQQLEMLCRKGEIVRFKFNFPTRYEYMKQDIINYIETAV